MASPSFHFTHYKLDAYRVARELADLVMELTPQVPEGHHKLVDQVVRAATGAELSPSPSRCPSDPNDIVDESCSTSVTSSDDIRVSVCITCGSSIASALTSALLRSR